ncbi:MBL fold metallo-hydrolase [Methanoplanus sp. FWC-SCC4]|uniref:MBL fold metallo-hydrolase n=2 Tax=Methanochimaera problematica TaxID=2609417 RepID=A0AA97FGA4_9EURY|nr:MBL fold metallo-hydrolase [Methanoplanus sp. FWC-SCC4]
MSVHWIRGEGYFANSYVFGSVLVDAGVSPVALKPFRDDIDTIILTHCHYDHIARVKEISHLCEAKVCIHKDDAGGLVDETPSLALMFGERSPGIVPDRMLSDGDIIKDLLVIHTPGHTPGGICLYNKEEKFLISGDTVFSDGGYGRFDFPGGNADKLKASIKRLSSLDVKALYPGHGDPMSSGGSENIGMALSMIEMSSY